METKTSKLQNEHGGQEIYETEKLYYEEQKDVRDGD
jgi:hypothetical protein